MNKFEITSVTQSDTGVMVEIDFTPVRALEHIAVDLIFNEVDSIPIDLAGQIIEGIMDEHNIQWGFTKSSRFGNRLYTIGTGRIMTVTTGNKKIIMSGPEGAETFYIMEPNSIDELAQYLLMFEIHN